jgi:membrane protein
VREAERVNVTAIGWVGVAVTIYAAIGLMVTVENCFNIIYRAPYGRTWTSRVPVYWFLLTLSPLVLVFSAYVDGRFQSLMRELQVRGWLSSAVGLFWSIFAIWIVMFAVYALFPNTRVRLRPAMAGALVAAILLEVGKRTMGMYLQNALSLSQLYGSLGLIPLFMFWVYLMWLAVLFGLQVSSTLQHLHGRQLAELESRRCEAMFIEPAVITVLMKRVAARFAMGRETSVDDLAETTGLTPQVVERIVDPLAAGPWLHRVAGRDGVVALSQPPERILIRELLEFAFGLAGRLNGGDSASTLMRRLRQVQQELTEDMHLGTLLQADVLPPESQTARSIIGRLQDPGLNGRARPAGAREMTSEMGLNQGEIES